MNKITQYTPSFQGLPKFQLKVNDKLVRGKAVTCPYRLLKMKRQGINQIIDLRNSAFIESPLEKFFCKILNIKYLNFPYKHRATSLPTHDFFEKINDRIIKNDGVTYIHCQYGKRRTGICTAIYEKEHTSKSNEEILNEIIQNGYLDVVAKKNDTKFNAKLKKYKNILQEFINTYLQK